MALERKTAAQAQLQDLDRQVTELEQQQAKLEANEKALSTKVEAFRSQKEVMKAQYSAAEASVRIGEAQTGIGDQMADAGAAIERARDKTEEMQARASAMDELIASGTLEDFTSGGETQLDRELAQLTTKSKVDDELAKMKAEIGTGSESGQKELEQ
jgi:phage shock protein A